MASNNHEIWYTCPLHGDWDARLHGNKCPQCAARRKKARYNLHYRLRQAGYKLNTRSRTVVICHADAAALQPKSLKRLVAEYGYAVQTSLLNRRELKK